MIPIMCGIRRVPSPVAVDKNIGGLASGADKGFFPDVGLNQRIAHVADRWEHSLLFRMLYPS